MPDEQDKPQAPSATSPGNEGSRGSRGAANSGAQPANSTNADGERMPVAQEPDTRDADAQGGGGIASDSSRSR